RWGNVGTFQVSPGSHMWQVLGDAHRKRERVPLTVCFGVPPACTLLAGGGFDYVILPYGCDELGVAGAAQGFPVRVVKARTVDAMAIADSEIELEGYVSHGVRIVVNVGHDAPLYMAWKYAQHS